MQVGPVLEGEAALDGDGGDRVAGDLQRHPASARPPPSGWIALATGAATSPPSAARSSRPGAASGSPSPLTPRARWTGPRSNRATAASTDTAARAAAPTVPQSTSRVTDVGQLVGDDQHDLVGPARRRVARPVRRPGPGGGQQGVVDDHLGGSGRGPTRRR